MADMAVTSANVRAMVEFGADVVAGLAGATLTVGYAVYQDSSGNWQHADANVSATVALTTGVLVETFDGEDTVIPATLAASVSAGRWRAMTPSRPARSTT
jgi:ABC-type molybdate transport system permease subunit